MEVMPMSQSQQRRGRWLSVATVLAVAATAAAQDSIKMYRLTELTISGATSSKAYAINNRQQIVGEVTLGETIHSAHWHNQTDTDLHGVVHFDLEHPLFDQGYSQAYDISDSGQITGTARTEVSCVSETVLCTHAFMLRPAVLSDLATPYPGDALANLLTLGPICSGAYDSAGTGISNTNLIVGWADRVDGTISAFLLVPIDGKFYEDTNPADEVNDLMVALNTISGGGTTDPVSSATAVNDDGYVTGYSYMTLADDRSAYRAFVVVPESTDPADWQADATDVWRTDDGGSNCRMVSIGTLGGQNSWGRDINNAADIVGESDMVTDDGSRYTHAFYYDFESATDDVNDCCSVTGTMSDLGTLRSDGVSGFSAASAINEYGVIVGWAENDNAQRRAFIYEDGAMQDLNELLYLVNDQGVWVAAGVVLNEARDINDDGVIVGFGTLRGTTTGQTRGFLLTPVMIDPDDLPEADDEDTTDDSSNGATNNAVDGGEDDEFGAPDHFQSAGSGQSVVNGTSDSDTSGNVNPAGLCGVGFLSMLPFTLFGLACLRGQMRRR
jgi:probable HAF family extracellular repeat protein